MNFFTLTFKKEKSDKFIFLFVISLIAISFLLIGAVNYFVDPFHIFDKSTVNKGYFSTNQRYQAAGLIDSYPAKNYIFGTSMTENFLSSEVSKTLGWSKLHRLSISGVLPKNYGTVLSYLLKRNKVENIILDAHWYFESMDVDKENEQHSFPSFLYTDSILDKMKYLFNHDTFKISFQVSMGNRKGFSNNLETINRWYKESLFKKFNSEESLKKVKSKLVKNKQIYNVEEVLQQGRTYKFPGLDKSILDISKRYPKTYFHIFLPPYTVWYYASQSNRQFIMRLIYMRKYLADKASKLKNIKVYGLDNEFDIVNNLKNYKDYGHYHPRINNKIIQVIKNQTNTLDKENSESYLRLMIKNINNYQL